MSFDFSAVAWLVVAVAAAIVEVLIPHFGLIFVALGAVAAALASAVGAGIGVQAAVFAVAVVGSLALLRPRLVARLRSRGVPSRTDALIGQAAVVTHDIDPTLGTGRVTVGGQDWAARSATAVSAGAHVRVVGADGIVLEVTQS